MEWTLVAKRSIGAFHSPFVKSGIVSAFEFGDVSKIYLDAHVNLGFSGGPVVFAPTGGSATDLRVAGVCYTLSYVTATRC